MASFQHFDKTTQNAMTKPDAVLDSLDVGRVQQVLDDLLLT
jgi:hypothetical protein